MEIMGDCGHAKQRDLKKNGKWLIRNLRTSGQATVILRYFLPEPVKEERRQA
jgi:hypothetical protein